MFNLAERKTGVFPLSIATSLAIEGGLGNHPDKPTNKNVIKRIPLYYINVDTLFRNIYNSVPTEYKTMINVEDMASTISQELEVIHRVLNDNTHKPKIVFYKCSKQSLKSKHPKAILRQNISPSHLIYLALQHDTYEHEILKELDIRNFDLLIDDVSSERTAILTHYPYDLFSKGLSNRLLWESHTGSFKGKSLWYTKFYNGKELPMIPFCLEMLQIFGDNEYFRPQSIRIKKAVMDTAVKYGWSQVTTKDKMLYSINKIEDISLKEEVREFLI